MAITYPLAFPTTKGLRRITIRMRSNAGVDESPYTFEQQAQAGQGDAMGADITIPPMVRADAEAFIAFLWALDGRAGTFLMGDPLGTSPRGTWAGSPKVLGAHAQRAKSIAMDGFTAGATVKAGDWIQTGSGSSTHLHKVVQDATADGSGLLTLEIRPGLRAALADNDTFVTASAKGLWRLASNVREYSIDLAQMYGVSFSAVEAL